MMTFCGLRIRRGGRIFAFTPKYANRVLSAFVEAAGVSRRSFLRSMGLAGITRRAPAALPSAPGCVSQFALGYRGGDAFPVDLAVGVLGKLTGNDDALWDHILGKCVAQYLPNR